jgi:multicomponent Na+:H+ antiporter subunit A
VVERKWLLRGGKKMERMDRVLRQWPAAGVSLLILTIALGAAVFAR